NMATNPSANSMGTSKRILPLHKVANQTKNRTPVGMEIISVVAEKNERLVITPVVNMWCAHTVNDSAVTRRKASTNPLYPYRGLPANTGMISDTIPQAPRISMYTSGWPKNQNV